MGRRVSYRKGLSVAAFLYAYYGRSVSFRFLSRSERDKSTSLRYGFFFKHGRSVSIRLYFPTAPVFNPCRRASHMERASRANVFLIHTLDCVCRMSSKSMWTTCQCEQIAFVVWVLRQCETNNCKRTLHSVRVSFFFSFSFCARHELCPCGELHRVRRNSLFYSVQSLTVVQATVVLQ